MQLLSAEYSVGTSSSNSSVMVGYLRRYSAVLLVNPVRSHRRFLLCAVGLYKVQHSALACTFIAGSVGGPYKQYSECCLAESGFAT